MQCLRQIAVCFAVERMNESLSTLGCLRKSTEKNSTKQNDKNKHCVGEQEKKHTTKYYIYCEQIAPSLTSLLLLLLLCTNERKKMSFIRCSKLNVLRLLFFSVFFLFSSFCCSDESDVLVFRFFMLVKYALKYV